MKPAERKEAVGLMAGLATTADAAFRLLNAGACVVPYLVEIEEIVQRLKLVEEAA